MKNQFDQLISKNSEILYKKKNFKFLKDKKILITGATGLLGIHFVSFFLESLKYNYKPKKITLVFKSSLPSNFNFLKKQKKFKLIRSKLDNIKNLDIQKQDYIIHLAGYGQPSKFSNYAIETFKLNTEVVVSLLEKINKNGYFLYLSSSEIYSGLKNDWTENRVGTANTDHPRAGYIQSKKSGETLVNLWAKKFNIYAKSIRLCLAYGPGNKKNDKRVLYQFIDKALKDKKIKMLDSGTEKRSYIYIADAMEMMINVLFFGTKNIYNIGGKEKVTILGLAKKIGKIIGVPALSPSKKKLNNIGAPSSAFVKNNVYNKEFKIKKMIDLNTGLKETIKWQKIINKN
mgnify:FL=1|jgi:UDP-glucuronate decarboxylase|tara:strand:+ start:19 stop:1050 length:1032 start_codon:yes stop_codon:yes gene_type:complete